MSKGFVAALTYLDKVSKSLGGDNSCPDTLILDDGISPYSSSVGKKADIMQIYARFNQGAPYANRCIFRC